MYQRILCGNILCSSTQQCVCGGGRLMEAGEVSIKDTDVIVLYEGRTDTGLHISIFKHGLHFIITIFDKW